MALSQAGANARRSTADYLNLSTCRQKCGLSLEQIAESTKISIGFLRAIEEGEYEKLPGGIYSTSYLRQYAAVIGFAEAEILAHFSRTTAPPPPADGEGAAARGILDRWFRVHAEVQRT